MLKLTKDRTKIVAAFLGMHVSPAKHSYASVTDRQTDNEQINPYVSLCFAGDAKTMLHSFNPGGIKIPPWHKLYVAATYS